MVLEKTLLTDILFYSLLTSHGIRVDTKLWLISSEKYAYVLDGYELRHLYPQEQSLTGFIEKVVLRKRVIPGLRLYPISLLDEIMGKNEICIVKTPIGTQCCLNNLFHGFHGFKASIQSKHRVFIVDSRKAMYTCLKHGIVRFIYEKYTPSFIVKTHYLLDILIGGWVRRHGEIKYYEPVIK